MSSGFNSFELDRIVVCAECDGEWEEAVYFDNNRADAMLRCPFCEDGYAIYKEDLNEQEYYG